MSDEAVSPALLPARAFDDAARLVVDYLSDVAPMGAWAVTRVTGGRQTVLVAADAAYGFLDPGASFPWARSFCRPMVAGESPRLVPETAAEPELAQALRAVAEQSVDVHAYVGTPIVRSDGSLFGTVCGFGQEPGLPDALVGAEALLDLLSSLLSSVLDADSAATDAARAAERAVEESETDPLTGLLNRRGWDRWVEREEERWRRFGDPASVVVLDLDLLKEVNDAEGHAAGDRYIQATARALRGVLPGSGALARLGGDEFAMVLCDDVDRARETVGRLEAALDAAGVLGSFGFAPYRIVSGFPGAVAEADAAMYAAKRRRVQQA